MGLPAVSSTLPFLVVVTLLIAAGTAVWWTVNQKWIAAQRRVAIETVQRAQVDAERIAKQAERDAESLRKEAALEAREKAYAAAFEAEHLLRQRRDEILTLEQALADKTRALADRLAANDRVEQELRAKERLVLQQQDEAFAARAKAE